MIRRLDVFRKLLYDRWVRIRLCVLLLLLGCLVTLASAQVSVPQRFADVELTKRDYASNISASDRNVYYANNSTGGVLPSVEYSNDRALA